MIEFIFVGIGGFIGSCLRFTFVKLCGLYHFSFPFATLLSNAIAGFLIGFVMGLEQQSPSLSVRSKQFITTGLLGGLSTFSTFSWETINLFRNQNYLLAFGNILLNLCLSLLGTVLGLCLAKIFFKKI